MFTKSRIWLFPFVLAAVFVVGALGIAACGGDDNGDGGAEAANSESESAGRAAFIGVAPVTQGNWDPAGYQAFIAMAEKHGLEPSNQESVGYDEAAAVLRRLAQENDLVIAHSSGYEAAVLEVAPEFPDTWFVVFSDLSTTNDLPNVAGWAVNWNEYGYLAGTAGCYAAKSAGSDAIGHVNSEPIPAFTRYSAGTSDAADAAGCSFEQVWINSFEDVARAKQAALSMINRGAGAISTSADTADEGSREAAVEADVYFVGNYTVDEAELAPDNTITSILIDYDGSYDEIGRLFVDDELDASIYPINVENGLLKFGPFQNVDEEVEQQSVDVLEQIKNGETEVDDTAELTP